MKTWFWTLLVFIAAVGLALLLRDHSGNVLILMHPWRIEISLTFAVVLIILAFVLVYAVLRLAAWLGAGPDRLRSWQGRRAQRRDFNLLESGWTHLLEGRLELADKDLQRLMGKGRSQTSKVVAALASARTNHQRGELARRNSALAQAQQYAQGDARLREAIAVVTAEMYLDDQQAGEALALLQPVQDASSRHFHATRLLLRAHHQLGHYDQVYALTRLLLRRDALGRPLAMQLIEESTVARLRVAGTDGYRGIWNDLKADEKALPGIALLAAEMQASIGQHDESARILETAIGKTMDVRLLAAYGQCPPEQVRRRLNKAEVWLKEKGDNPTLLATMGRLCLVGELWGLAERYLLESMRLRSDVRIHALLGNLYDAQGRQRQAAHHWRQACQVAGRLPASGAALADADADVLLVPLSSEVPPPVTEDQPDAALPPAEKADHENTGEYFDTAPIPGIDVTQTSDHPRGAAKPS